MRAAKLLLFVLLLLGGPLSYGQSSEAAKASAAPEPPKLTRFDLDFPGGTPDELVTAIQKAVGRPLNAVVPVQYANIQLPPLKMRGVDVAQLFGAMFQASQHQEATVGFGNFDVTYGFRTGGTPTDSSVWFFTARLPLTSPTQRYCSYFLLTPYLEKGLTVDDITTAIQTGWKMLGDSTGQDMRYHPETRLLIVVADPAHFEVVRSALGALDHWKSNVSAQTSNSKSDEGSKSKQ